MNNSFNNIEEIIDYLSTYQKAEYFSNKPYIDKEPNQTIYSMGYIIYDKKIFDIPTYLKENNYISEEYYNREKYPEFFEEDWHTWDYENIDIKRISYLILRTYNVERMCEGAINHLASSGIFLKLIKRLKELKK